MGNLLIINASGRVSRSITRRLSHQFADQWQTANPKGKLVFRDVGQNPPAAVNEDWIASAFADDKDRTAVMRQALQTSDYLLNELEEADAVVLSTPMYNFGLPAALKAYFDQIIRVNRSFEFDPTVEEPYRPLLRDKPVTIIVSLGDGSLLPGGEMAHLNFLESHLKTLLGFVGLTRLDFVRVGFEEYQDQRLKRSLESAQDRVSELASRG